MFLFLTVHLYLEQGRNNCLRKCQNYEVESSSKIYFFDIFGRKSFGIFGAIWQQNFMCLTIIDEVRKEPFIYVTSQTNKKIGGD